MMDGMAGSGVEADRLLWAAVVRRAIHDYVLYKGVRRKSMDWKRAHLYLFGEGVRHEEGLSFEDVCALLEWDPDYVRKLTLMMQRSDIMKSTPKKPKPVVEEMQEQAEKMSRWRQTAMPHLPLWHPVVRIHFCYRPAEAPFVQWA
jgi:hypothetical protein